MSDQHSDAKIDTTAPPAADIMALPLIEAPTLSPAAETAAADASPVESAPSETAETPSPTIAPTATQRFRAAAAAQIAAARDRLASRNVSSVMAVALIASLGGAFGAVLATNAIAHFAPAPPDQRAAHTQAIADSIARIEDDIAALRGKVERTAELNATQTDKTGQRLDAIEKAQVEPLAKLGKLSDAVEKLRVAQAALSASAQSAGSDITGSIKSTSPTMPGKASKPAIVEGWTLLEVDRDAALLEGKRGLFETYIGDTIPGVGRVESFRKQDGRWVIVTAKGLIVPR